MLKQHIREAYQTRRKALSPADYAHFSRAILDRFAAYPFPPIHMVMTYAALKSRNEFDPSPCIDQLVQHRPAIKSVWPKITDGDHHLEACMADGHSPFVENRYGIPEPATDTFINPEQIDLVFVPLLAFDARGYRVGYGKGYYDRFLTLCNPAVIRVGFSFFDPLPEISDIGQFDVPLSVCITPMRLYEF